ncbi:MAG: hypothetical protein HYX48_07770 [Chlamydiales bacterium]|nr:hypothetical protein [Chlamydiales bacterium]
MTPASFTAQYLHFGARMMEPPREEVAEGQAPFSCEEGLLAMARGAYSLGVCVAAPAGILYHISCVAYIALEQLCAPEPAALSTKKHEHLLAAGYDLIGLLTLTISALLIGTVALALLAEEPLLLLYPLLVMLGIVAMDANPETRPLLQYSCLPYGYATNPLQTVEMLDLSPT